MPIEHKDIPENGLHEPKGVSLASAGEAYYADGASSGDWRNGLVDIVPIAEWSNGVAQDVPINFTDPPTQISFGTAASTPEFNLTGSGDIVCNVSGTYLFEFVFDLRLPYNGTSVDIGILLMRFLLDGVDKYGTFVERLESRPPPEPLETRQLKITKVEKLSQGQVLKVEITSDEQSVLASTQRPGMTSYFYDTSSSAASPVWNSPSAGGGAKVKISRMIVK